MMNNENQTQNPIPAERRDAIYRIVKEEGIIRVNELSEMFNVTEMTIRRDLEVLERKGLLERTHGGAMWSDRMELEPHYAQRLWEQKRLLHKKEKEAIGRYAVGLIKEGDTIFVNSGSTTLQFLRNLDVNFVKVISNNPFAPVEVKADKITVVSTGGELRRESYTLVGETATQMIKEVFGSKAVMGVDGISVKHGMTTPVQSEAWLNRLMIERTHGQIIVLADSSKIGKVSNFLTVPIDAVDVIVTDDGIDPQHLEEFESVGIQVVRVSVDRQTT